MTEGMSKLSPSSEISMQQNCRNLATCCAESHSYSFLASRHSQQCRSSTVVTHFSAVLRPGCLHFLKQERKHIKTSAQTPFVCSKQHIDLTSFPLKFIFSPTDAFKTQPTQSKVQTNVQCKIAHLCRRCFLAKTWCLHYPRNLTIWVGIRVCKGSIG